MQEAFRDNEAFWLWDASVRVNPIRFPRFYRAVNNARYGDVVMHSIVGHSIYSTTEEGEKSLNCFDNTFQICYVISHCTFHIFEIL